MTMVQRWFFIVVLAASTSCTSETDGGEPPDDPTGDPDPNPGSPSPSGPDGASPQPTPGSPDAAPAPSGPACAEPGATGNTKGVGEFCTKGGGECDDNDGATYCTVDYRDDAPPFCTTICFGDDTCGEDAVCASDGSDSLMGCTPTCLMGGM